jgi:hypothetical protein
LRLAGLAEPLRGGVKICPHCGEAYEGPAQSNAHCLLGQRGRGMEGEGR